MHAIFMLYGRKQSVEHLMMDMQAQKHQVTLYKDNVEYKQWIQGNLRLLPFGFYEYVFPKEDKDMVLTTLNFHTKTDRYSFGQTRMLIFQKLLRADKIPKFSTDKQYLWIKDDVEIIPIGIREDKDTIENGVRHEAI